MKIIKHITSMLCLAAAAVIVASCGSSINPILTDAYAADPSAVVFGGTLFAHKSYVVRWNDVTYHFYCAVNESGERGIALTTSE